MVLTRDVKKYCEEKGFPVVAIKFVMCYDAPLEEHGMDILSDSNYSIAVVENKKGEKEAVVFFGSWISQKSKFSGKRKYLNNSY